MHQLISIDHESRTNSHHAEEDPRTSEATPLLQRFPRNPGQIGNRRHTAVIVSLLLVILLSGMIIGIYLLIIQSRSENILPPIETPMRFVRSTRRVKSAVVPEQEGLPESKISQVIVVETDTEQCNTQIACKELINTMQMTKSSILPYNFLISSNGNTFEALGWRRRSVWFPEYDSNAIVLAFIGNYTATAPNRAQLQQAEAFLTEALRQQRLTSDFVIIGKRTKEFPKNPSFTHVNVASTLLHLLISLLLKQLLFKMPVPFRGRFHWGKNTDVQSITLMPLSKATKTDVAAKDTSQCDGVEACTILLNTMQVVPRKKRQSGFKC